MPDKIIADNLEYLPTLEGHWRAIHRKLGSVNRCQAGFLFAEIRQGNPNLTATRHLLCGATFFAVLLFASFRISS